MKMNDNKPTSFEATAAAKKDAQKVSSTAVPPGGQSQGGGNYVGLTRAQILNE